jgi:hypothetical protein
VAIEPPSDSLHARLGQVKAAAEKLGKATHAGFAMVVAAKLDRTLEFALRARMSGLNRELNDKLYGEYGLVRDFSSKILLTHCLNLIDRETYKRLTGIRRIRNLFAHSNEELNLESEAVQELVAKELSSADSIKSPHDLMRLVIEVEQVIAKAINAGNPQRK